MDFEYDCFSFDALYEKTALECGLYDEQNFVEYGEEEVFYEYNAGYYY